MFSITKLPRLSSAVVIWSVTRQLRLLGTEVSKSRRRSRSSVSVLKKINKGSEWWIVDGEMHEIGDNVPPRERFVIPRDNIPNKRRKQLREQFMRRTRLVLSESGHEPWCKRYMELYQELRENWERLYWDEGYSKKIAHDHANYDSADDDDKDFTPYRKSEWIKEQSFERERRHDMWDKVGQIRDKFEYDRDKRMREKAFAPMNWEASSRSPNFEPRYQPVPEQHGHGQPNLQSRSSLPQKSHSLSASAPQHKYAAYSDILFDRSAHTNQPDGS